jgi:hypothetical protein
MATSHSDDEEVDGTPYEGDRPGAHPVDVLGELPIDGEQTAEMQLMPDADLDPREVQGDRFDVDDDDLGMAPDLEEEPDAPDLQPDSIERIADSDESEDESEPDDLDDRITARPSSRTAGDALSDEPIEPG